MDALYPVIHKESDDPADWTRLFNPELEDAIRASEEDWYGEPAILKRLANAYTGLYNAKPGGETAYYKGELERIGADLDRERSNPTPRYDSLTFAGKVSSQLAFVDATPPMWYSKASDEEVESENARYSRYVRRITAEAEIVALWNSL
jgi:hypothetical protein